MKRGVLFLIPVLISAFADSPAWVEKSNRNAQVLLKLQARFFPESAGKSGVSGVDEQIIDMKPDAPERQMQAMKAAELELVARLGLEKDPLVRQDLEILIGAVRDSNRGIGLNRKYYVPYANVAQIVYGGLNGLLDDQIAVNRRPAALARLRRYTGMEQGYTPIAILAEQRTRERLGQAARARINWFSMISAPQSPQSA